MGEIFYRKLSRPEFERFREIDRSEVVEEIYYYRKDYLKLEILHVSNAYRQCGVGRKLVELAKAEALARGAQKLYISATPSKNTIDFYTNLGCQLTTEIDPELFKLEPEDIHLELKLA